ncbi:hypothetical protein [Nesterenkonia alba]|uniref:hypothetical protein n=1 Tax=Nesterenkonia alba TaxID=515814 RepID=UPI0012ECA393|nr:hypothetical protein [Nesterenkonia alba]
MADNSPLQSITLSSGLVVRELTNYGELKQACQLYRGVFGYTGEDESINPRMLTSLRLHGGSVVGAVDPSGTVLAFAYGWTALDSADAMTGTTDGVYHFSQAAVVSSVLQGQGVGRSLKRVQADVASRYGAHRMRWTYDPLLARNAHFNLDVLGAVGRWYTPDAQGLPGTDRITVEWQFAPREDPSHQEHAPHQHRLPALEVGEVRQEQDTVYLGVPAAKPVDPDLAAQLRHRIAGLFSQGWQAVSCTRSDAHTAVYTFTSP